MRTNLIRRRFTRLAAASGLFAVILAAADVPAGSHTHTLFMGADIDLQQSKAYYRVHDVSGGSFIIKIDGKEKSVPMKFNSVGLKLNHQLKLAETSVNVEKLKVERGYTPGNDPNQKFAASLAASAADAQLSNDAQLVSMTYQAGVNAQRHQDSGAPGTVSGFANDPDYAGQARDAMRNFNSSAGAMGSDVNSAGVSAGKLNQELAEGMFDAIEITFEVSSEKPLNSPYAVVVAQFGEKGAKPNEVQNWIFATELEPITSELRRVRIKQGGFPRCFEIKNHQVHLYNRGQEVATTVAAKRVELTREEAFEYVLIDYLTSHKGQTLPASLAMGRLPASVRNSLQLPALFVKVTKDGLPLAAFTDENCARKIDDPALVAALGDLRFKPALNQGKTVEGIARLTL